MNNFRVFHSHKAETQAIRRITILTAFWLALGLGVSTVVALLYAPAIAKRRHHSLADTFQERLSSGQEALEPVVKQLQKQVDELRHTVEDRITKMR